MKLKKAIKIIEDISAVTAREDRALAWRTIRKALKDRNLENVK